LIDNDNDIVAYTIKMCAEIVMSCLQIRMIRSALKTEKMNYVTVLRALELPGRNCLKLNYN